MKFIHEVDKNCHNGETDYPTVSGNELYCALNLEFRFSRDTRDPVSLWPTDHSIRPFDYFTPWTEERVFLWLIGIDEPGKWLHKAFEQADSKDALVVSVVPYARYTSWWQEFSKKATEVRYPLVRVRIDHSFIVFDYDIAIMIFRPHS